MTACIFNLGQIRAWPWGERQNSTRKLKSDGRHLEGNGQHDHVCVMCLGRRFPILTHGF